jgi:hypothetical protein
MTIPLKREDEFCELINTNKSDSNCVQIGTLGGGRWSKIHEIARRVYSIDSNSPTLHCCGGGNLEVKILEVNNE